MSQSLHPLIRFDGTVPAPGVIRLNVALPVFPSIRGAPSRRHPVTLAAVINQFAVANNPRYVPRDTSGDGRRDTHCDALAADVCDAMGVVLPQWMDATGTPSKPGHGSELNANGMARWLRQHGVRFGWRPVPRAEVQALANLGHPALVVWENPAGSGHIAPVRPAEAHDEGPIIAQAGSRLFNRGTVRQGFGEHAAAVRFYVNDVGTVVNEP